MMHTLVEQGRVNMSERAVALYAMLFSRKRVPPSSSGLCKTPHQGCRSAAVLAYDRGLIEQPCI